MYRDIKTRLVKSFKSRKLHVFGLFFVLALVFLMITKLSREYIETMYFKIDYQHIPIEKNIKVDSTFMLEVTVKDYGYNLLPFYLFDRNINVDFEKDVNLKDETFVWESKNAIPKIAENFGAGVNIISVKPDQLIFPFEKSLTKSVPIEVVSDIVYAKGFDRSSEIMIEPDHITLVGTAEALEKVDKVLTTKISLKDVKSDFVKEISLDFSGDLKSLKRSKERVSVSAKVEKFTEGTFDIPISIINLPSSISINYFPKSITVAYYVSLKDYKQIKVTDFRVECDFNDVIKDKQTYLLPKLVKSPGLVKTTRLKQNKVEFIVIK